MNVRELHALINAEFEKAKLDYLDAEANDDVESIEVLARLQGRYWAWSYARDLFYKAVHGE